MLNQLVLVGRIAKIINYDSKNKAIIKLAVPRSYKNENDEYETDIFSFNLIGSVFKNSKGYLEKGDMIGIKGRLETKNDKIEIIAEKVTFLRTNKDIEKEEKK